MRRRTFYNAKTYFEAVGKIILTDNLFYVKMKKIKVYVY